MNGDFPPVAKNKVTKVLELVPFEEQTDELKKKLAKNNEAKMVLYNALPKKEYERIFMCKRAKDIWQSFKKYVRKFLKALHPKWRAKVTMIEESKVLSSLALDELIGNLKVHEVVMKKDSEIYKGKKERVKSIALKAKKEQPCEEKKSFRKRDDKKGKSDRKFFRCGDPNHLIGKCLKPPRNKDQKAFVGGCWSDSENKVEDKINDETCLMAQSSNEVTLDSSHYSDDASSFDDDKLNEKIKKLEINKEVDIGCVSCQQLRLGNTKLKENQVKFVKFDKSANSLRKMLNVQKSPSCKIGLGFDKSNASTSGTKPMSFVGSKVVLAGDGSTLKADESTLLGSVDSSTNQKQAQHVFIPPMSLRSDFVIVRKKLIHNSIDNSKRTLVKPSLKNGLGYVKTESRSKTPPPKRNNSSQQRHNTPQPRRNSSGPIYQSHYPMNWNNNHSRFCTYGKLHPISISQPNAPNA
ncbi:hypothetical protein Tco_1466480 [Tanacetum coccineum]